jgi:hypothetical protein
MDPISQLLLLSFKTQADHQVGLIARQGDGAQQDNRILTVAAVNELFAGALPNNVGGLNTASHAPVPQPWGGTATTPAPKVGP